ncbi:MAG: hypothetical protein K0R21_127 [Anaerocolumna sp.]|nr:hypothetical protein [Anaerocolumna sp.]
MGSILNNQKSNKIYNVLSMIPAIVIMVGIFYFSSQDALESSSLSGGIVENIYQVIEKFFNWELTAAHRIQRLELFETGIRKAAHMTEYSLLAVTVAYPLYLYGSRGYKLVLRTELISILYAVTDEIHQLYVPGRSGQISDVLIDGTGALIGCLLFVFLGVRHHKL